jgi:hypothetical protein
MSSKIKYFAFVFILLFVISFFLPIINLNSESILGYQFYTFRLAKIIFISDFYSYILYLLEALLILWILLLSIWILKKRQNIYLISLISLFALITIFYWLFQIEDMNTIAYGFWIMAFSILGISISAFVKIKY